MRKEPLLFIAKPGSLKLNFGRTMPNRVPSKIIVSRISEVSPLI